MVLGPYLKYSSGYWPKPETTLEESEVIMLEMYCERAGLQDGMRIIDLGIAECNKSFFTVTKSTLLQYVL